MLYCGKFNYQFYIQGSATNKEEMNLNKIIYLAYKEASAFKNVL